MGLDSFVFYKSPWAVFGVAVHLLGNSFSVMTWISVFIKARVIIHRWGQTFPRWAWPRARCVSSSCIRLPRGVSTTHCVLCLLLRVPSRALVVYSHASSVKYLGLFANPWGSLSVHLPLLWTSVLWTPAALVSLASVASPQFRESADSASVYPPSAVTVSGDHHRALKGHCPPLPDI